MNILILLAAGSGTRFSRDKSLEYLSGKQMFHHALIAAEKCHDIHGIVLVCSRTNAALLSSGTRGYPKVLGVVHGGKTRFLSSAQGYFKAKEWNPDILVFHNVANPFVLPEEFSRVLRAAKKYGSAGVAHRVTSTLRKEEGGILPREHIWAMETPQAIRRDIFERGLALLLSEDGIEKMPTKDITDDLSVAEYSGNIPHILPASPENKKITYLEDIPKTPYEFLRIGIGQDSHPFSDDGCLVLGGIHIPEAPKLLGNSDGDALFHALTNALSSAMGGGSLSSFSDPLCASGIKDSAAYLRHILQANIHGYQLSHIVNISIALEGKQPKLESYFAQMKTRISEMCSVPESCIGITATTGEGLTDVGKGKGIAVFTQVLVVLRRESSPPLETEDV